MNTLQLSATLVDRLGWVLIHSVWQLAIIALVAFVLEFALRKCSSVTRYGMLLLALGTMVTSPVVTFFVLLSNEPVPAQTIVTNSLGPTGDETRGENNLGLPVEFGPTATVVEPPVPLPSTTTIPGDIEVKQTARMMPSETALPRTWRSVAEEAVRPWLNLIVVFWFVGACLFALRPALSWYNVQRLRRVGVSSVPENVALALNRVVQQMKLWQTIQVLQSTLIRVPVVIGYWRPIVLLPVSIVSNLPVSQLEAILTHELAHVRRHDYLVNLLQTLIEAIFFYHPALWWLSHRIRTERENCCDDVAIALLNNRVEYGRALLALEELRGRRTLAALGATDGSLLSRVRRIVGVGSDRAAVRLIDRWPAALLSLACLGVMVMLSMNWNVTAKEDRDKEATSENTSSAAVVGDELSEPRFSDGLRLELKREMAHGGKWFFVDLDHGLMAKPTFDVEIDTKQLPYIVVQPTEERLNEWLVREGVDLILFSEAKLFGDGSGRMSQQIQIRSVRTNLADVANGLKQRGDGSWTWTTQPSEVVAQFVRKDDTTHVSGFVPNSSGGEVRADSPRLHPFRTSRNSVGLFLLEQPNALKDEMTLRIAHVANSTAPLDDVQFGKGDFVSGRNMSVRLPDGQLIELIGVSTTIGQENQPDTQPWWWGNGQPLEQPPREIQRSGRSVVPAELAKGREAVFQVSASTGSPTLRLVAHPFGASLKSMFETVRWNSRIEPIDQARGIVGQIGNPHSSLLYAAFGPVGETKSANLRLGVVGDPVTLQFNSKGQPINQPTNHSVREINRRVSVLKAGPHQKGVAIWTRPLREIGELGRCLIVATDRNGQTHLPTSSEMDEGAERTAFDIAPKNLKVIELRISPFRYWITFENISLVARHQTDMKIKVETLPTEPARLRVLNPDGLRVQSNESVVIASMGFPRQRLEHWVGEPDRDGMVSLEKLPNGTHWLLAGWQALLPVTLPSKEMIIERRLRAGRVWVGENAEIGRQPTVEVDDKVGEVVVIEIQNRGKEALNITEEDLHIKTMVGDRLYRCFSPHWLRADHETFPQITIDPGHSRQIRLNWRVWATHGLWVLREHEVITEPAWPPPAPGQICVCVVFEKTSTLAATVTDPVEIFSKAEKDAVAAWERRLAPYRNLRDEDVEKFVLDKLRTPFEPDLGGGSWQGGAYESDLLGSLSMVRQQDRVVKVLMKVVERQEPATLDQRRLAMMYLGGAAPLQVVPLIIKELEKANFLPTDQLHPYHEIAVLAQIGEEARDAIPVLIKLLDSQDGLACSEALQALVKVGPSSSEVMNAIAQRFGKPDEDVWSRAVYEVGRYGELAKPLGPTFVKLLDSKSKEARIWAAQALVKSGYDEARGFNALIGDVAVGKTADRSQAATALAALGSQAKSIIPKLRPYENDPDVSVAKEVRDAIRRIEKDDRIFTHAELAAKAAIARKAVEEAKANLRAAAEPPGNFEGVIDDVAAAAIAFADGKVIKTDAATKYVRLTDKGEQPAERNELKAGIRVRYQLAAGKPTEKVLILAANPNGQQQATALAPNWGEVMNGLRARIVPVLSSMSEDAIDMAQRVTTFKNPDDVAFAVELENVSDKPIKLLDTRLGENFTEKGKADSNGLGPFLFSVELFDRDGKLIEQPEASLLDPHQVFVWPQVATLEPGKTHRFLLRPTKWLSPLSPRLEPGHFRAAVRYHGLPAHIAKAMKDYKPNSPVLVAVAGDVVTPQVSFEVQLPDVPVVTAGGLTVEQEKMAATKPTLVWGESVNGLRAAMSFAPVRASHAHGERPEVKLHVQNVSDKLITFLPPLTKPEFGFVIKNDKGEPVDIEGVTLLGRRLVGRVVLKPQQVVVLDGGHLALAISKDRVRNAETFTPQTLVASEGKYSMQVATYFGNFVNFEGEKETELTKNAWVGELKTGATPLTITNEVIDGEIVDAVTGKLISDTTTTFRFIKPKSADAAETTVELLAWGPKGTGHIYFTIPDRVMQRADREELEVQWGVGNHPDYENFSPTERIPLKEFFHEGPKTARKVLSKIKLTPKKVAKGTDDEVRVGPLDAHSGVALLANGLKFELVAIAHANVNSADGAKRKAEGWWRPDGTKLDAAPAGVKPLTVTPTSNHANFRELVFRVQPQFDELRPMVAKRGMLVQPWNTQALVTDGWSDDGVLQFQIAKSFTFQGDSPGQTSLYLTDLPLVKAAVVDLSGKLVPDPAADVRTKLLLQQVHVTGIEKSATETVLKLKSHARDERVQVEVTAVLLNGQTVRAVDTVDLERRVISRPASEISSFEIRLRPMTHGVIFNRFAMLPGQKVKLETTVRPLESCVDFSFSLKGELLGMIGDVATSELEMRLKQFQHDLNSETGVITIYTSNRATYEETDRLLTKLNADGWKWPRLGIRPRVIECDIVDAVTGKPVSGTTVNFRFLKPKTGDKPEEIVSDIFWGPTAPSHLYFSIPDEVNARPDRQEIEVAWSVAQHDDYEPFAPKDRLKLKPFLAGDAKLAVETLSNIKLTPKKNVKAKAGTSSLKIKYEMPEAEAETRLHVERIDPKRPTKDWRREEFGNEEYGAVRFSRLKNGESLKLENLPAGRYRVGRYRLVDMVREGTGKAMRPALLDSQMIDLAERDTQSINLTRPAGHSISGRVKVPADWKVNTLVVHVCNEKVGGCGTLNHPDVRQFDLLNADIAGQFKSEPLPAGQYKVVVEGYANHSLALSGVIAPSWEGSAEVTVQEPQEPTPIELTLREVDRDEWFKDQVAAEKARVERDANPPAEAANDKQTSELRLADLVREFNAENKRLGRGLDQPAVTEDEVIASIERDEWKRGDPWSLNEKEIGVFKRIAASKQAPQGSHLDVFTEDRYDTFSSKHLWQVRLMIPAIGHDSFVGMTIRKTVIAMEEIDPKEVAWGKPDAEGLSLGVYLSPKKDKYVIGERVRLRLFVRNESAKAVGGLTFYNRPTLATEDFTVTDQMKANVAVRVANDLWAEQLPAGATAGALAPGGVHAFRIPYELVIGGDDTKNELIGRIIDAQPGQKLQLKVRAFNGNDRAKDKPLPESGNVTFAVAAADTVAQAEQKEETVVGTVVSPDGKPVVGVEVLAFRGEQQLEPKFKTDERGEIRVPKEWRETESWLTLVARDGRERLGWFDFMVHRHSDIGQKAEDGSFKLVLLPMSRAVRGRLLDEKGQPLAKVPVRINQLDHNVNQMAVHWRYQSLGGEPLVRGDVTDNEGRFEVKVPADSTAWLGTDHPDWVEKTVIFRKDTDDAADTKLVRAAKVTGRVTDARTGKPLARVVIAALATKTEIGESSGEEAKTDADGNYVITGLRAGEYTIQLEQIPFKTLTAAAHTGVNLKTGESHQANFALNLGQRLTGRVLHLDTGEPIPGCKVNCTNPAHPLSGFHTETNEKGEFEFLVPPGKSNVSATEGRRFSNDSTRKVDVPTEGEVAPITLKAGDKTESVPGSFKIFLGPPLERKVSLHFQRAPLVEVLTKACDAAAVKLELDADGLKSAGYTKNTAVTIDADNVTLREALTQILKPFEKLSFTLGKNQLFVSIRSQVEAREKPAEPKPPADEEKAEAKLQPQSKESRELFETWQRTARASGNIPGGTLGPLVRVMRNFVKNNPTHEAAPKFAELLKRVDVTRDWSHDEAVKLLDEVAAIYPSLPKWVDEEKHFTLGGNVVVGKPLPDELKDAPWGEAQANGLRGAWLLEPRGTEHRLNTPLKSRVLFHNSGKNSITFRALTWNQSAGHKAQDALGKDIHVNSTYWTTIPMTFACRLAPGEFHEVTGAGIGVGANKDNEDWRDARSDFRVGAWIEANAGDEVTFFPDVVNAAARGRPVPEGEEAETAPQLWWLKFIKDRLSLDAPLPADADERGRLLDRVMRDLFGNAPTEAELNAFKNDATPEAFDSLAKRLSERSGFESFSGLLKSGPTKFKVLPVDPDAAKKPRTAKGPGKYKLGGATFVVTRRPIGERVVNEAHLSFSQDDATKPARKSHPVPLPDDYDTWLAAWLRDGTVMWVAQKGTQEGANQKPIIRRYDFTDAASVKESTITELKPSATVPQAILDALLPVSTRSQPKAGNEKSGFDFLKQYPKLHGLSLDMTEPQFLEIVKQQELKTRKIVEGEKITHYLALGDGHSLVVMFDKDGKCSGIQRVRGEEPTPIKAVDPLQRPVSLTAKDMPLKTALEKLARDAGLKVEFDVEALKQVELDLQQPVTASFDKVSLQTALGRVIDWRNYLGAMREVRGDTLVLTTLDVWQKRIVERLPEWMKPLFNNGLLATLDDNNNVATVTTSSIVTDELLAKLASLPQLKELHIEVTKGVTPAGLAHLGKMARLEKLSLYNVNTEGAGLGDDAIRSVIGLKSLRGLTVNECGTTDAGAKLLEQLPQLTSLSLGQEGKLTDEALKSIGKLSKLESLSLNTYVGNERLGWMRFSEAGVRQLRDLKSLKSLHLIGQEVPADALDFPQLTSLSLGHASIGDAVVAKIGELRSLQTIELTYCTFGNIGLKAIASLPDLRRLTISGSMIDDAGIEFLRPNKTLEHITLRVGRLTDKSLEHVAQIKTLTRLDLYGSGYPGVAPGRIFGMAGLQQLKQLPKLETLYLTNFELAGGYYAGLKELGQLRELSMMMCDITNGELEILEDALPNTSISHMTGGDSWTPKKLRQRFQKTQTSNATNSNAKYVAGISPQAPLEKTEDPHEATLKMLDTAAMAECRGLIKRFDEAGEVKLAAMARERLAKRWKAIAEQPVASFLRELPKVDPKNGPKFDRGPTTGVQTDLDGVWAEGKGTADDWKDWIVRKQNGYRVGRLHMLFEAAQGYRKGEDVVSAKRVLQAGLSGHEIYDVDLKTLIGKYWPITNDDSAKSFGSAPEAWTLANYLAELSSAQQKLGEIDAAIITHSRLMLVHFMLSWSQPSDGPNKHARELWSLIRQRPELLPPLFWFNLVDEKNAQHKFDLSTAGQKGKPLTYHYYNMAAAPSLDFAELTITARTRGRKGILDCYRINAAGKHETIILLQPSADGEPVQTLTKTLAIPEGTGLVQFMVAGEDFQVGEVTVEAKFVKRPAVANVSPPVGLEFLKQYPKLHGLSFAMTEPQFLEIVKQQELPWHVLVSRAGGVLQVEKLKDWNTVKKLESDKVTHRIALGDGHSLIVTFGKDGKCGDIQRVRDEALSGRLFVNAGVRTVKDETRISQSVIAIDPGTGKWTRLQSLNETGFTVPLSPVRVSPDGQTMLFMRGDELWKCDANTGERAVRVLEKGSPAAWAPDSKAFVVVIPTSERDSQMIENWIVSSDGKKQSVLALPKGDEVEDWSTDGQWLSVRSRLNSQVSIVKPDGSGRRRLADSAGYAMGRTSFSPDGQRLVYLRDQELDGISYHSLRIINIDGTDDREILGEKKVGSNPDSEKWTAPMAARWSPDGKHLAVVLFDHARDGGITAINGNWRLAIINPDGSNLRELKLEGMLTTVLPWDGPEWIAIPPVVPAGGSATSQRDTALSDDEFLKMLSKSDTSLHALSLSMTEVRFKAMMRECAIPMQTMRGDGSKVNYTIQTGYDRDILVKFDNGKCGVIQPIPRVAWPKQVSFESLTVAFNNSFGGKPPEQIVIKGNGDCLYQVDEVPARGTIAKRPGARITSKVHPQRMLELERLLAETGWLTKKPDDAKVLPSSHSEETPITVERGGVTTTVKCVAPRDDLYRTLLWLLRGTAKQERFIYSIDWSSDNVTERNLALHEIRMDIEALEGSPGRALPQFDYDYHRLLTTFSRLLRNPNEQEEPLITAIKVASITREDSEFDAIARWRHDRSSNVRNTVAIAITESAMVGRAGDRQLVLLPEMVSSSEEARWGLIRMGDFAIPAIVKLIEPGSTANDIVSEQMVRTYLDHRKELTSPLDARIITAVRQALAATKARPSQRIEYYEEFLKWAGQLPVKSPPAESP